MTNHQHLFFWLSDVKKISQSEDKFFVSLEDEAGNDVIIYGDYEGRLFDVFVDILKHRCGEVTVERYDDKVKTGETFTNDDPKSNESD